MAGWFIQHLLLRAPAIAPVPGAAIISRDRHSRQAIPGSSIPAPDQCLVSGFQLLVSGDRNEFPRISGAITYKVHVSHIRSLLACATRNSRPMGPSPDCFSLVIVVQLVLQLFRVLRIMSTQSTRGESYTRPWTDLGKESLLLARGGNRTISPLVLAGASIDRTARVRPDLDGLMNVRGGRRRRGHSGARSGSANGRALNVVCISDDPLVVLQRCRRQGFLFDKVGSLSASCLQLYNQTDRQATNPFQKRYPEWYEGSRHPCDGGRQDDRA